MNDNPLATAYEALLEERENTERIVEDLVHELRTPLSNVKGFAEILLYHRPEDAACEQEFLTIILNESRRMQRLIQDLLFDIRKARRTDPPHQGRVCAEELIERSARAVQGLLMESGVELYRSVEEDLPPFPGDGDKLVQVLVNLLSNAAKFSAPGSPILVEADVLNADPLGAKGPFMHITVRDQGSGIPAEALPHLFERFHTAGHTDGEEAKKGTGLGLAICREIVSRHHGRIWAESIYGSGSAFHVTVPLHPPLLKPLQVRYGTETADPVPSLLC